MIKVNGQKYEVTQRENHKVDGYLVKGIIETEVEDEHKYKGLIAIDGQNIAVKTKGSKLLVMGIVICAIIIGIIVYLLVDLFLNREKPIPELDFGDTQVIINRDNGKILNNKPVFIRYNKFMLYDNGVLDIRLVNSQYDATVEIVGEDITCTPVEVLGDAELPTIAIVVSTDKEIINASLIYTYEKGVLEYPIVIENLQPVEASNQVSFETEEVLHE